MTDPVNRLTEGLTPQQQNALGDLAPLARRLDQVPAPDSTPEARAALLTHLAAYLPQAEEPPLATPPSGGWRHWLRLALAQAALFESSFWLACLLVAVLGIAAILLDSGAPAVLLILLSPVLASAGVAYAFRPATQTLWELERITPTGPLELIYARLGLALGGNLLVALALLAAIWLREPQLVLWRLALAWLGPLLLLAGLALYVTFRWGSLAGAIGPLALWCSLILLGWWEAHRLGPVDMLQLEWLLEQASRSNPLLIFSLLTALLGTVLLWQAARLSNQELPAWN